MSTRTTVLRRTFVAAIAVAAVTASALAAVAASSGSDDESALEVYAAKRVAAAEAESGSYLGPENIRLALPNVRYKLFENRPAHTHVVRGSVTSIEREKAMWRTPAGKYGDDEMLGDIVYGPFDSDNAYFRILLVTVSVDEVIAGPEVSEVRFEWLVQGPALGRPGDPGLVEEALHELGDAIWFLTDYGTDQDDGRMRVDPMRGVVDDAGDGQLSLPFMPREEIPVWLDGVRTVEDLREQARQPEREVTGIPGSPGN